ncbi:MAG: TniQ family protein [Lachnospiraceae bacterium]|nr:TniQ family protein [Lachnospiraceae bacterium]
MIACFPEVYTDELVYSWFARYSVKSGHVSYRYVAEELYQSRTNRPDFEFYNCLTTTAYNILTKEKPIEKIIMEHTMFPCYGRFISKERKNKAFQSLVEMQGNYNNLLPIPKRKSDADRYLRYCPMCAESDREQYGETYWHRNHQLMGINVCSVHGCRLVDSDVIISGKASPCLITAEESIQSSIGADMVDNMIENQFAKYATAVFQSELDLQSEIRIGDFLHSKMSGTKYRSARGEQRNIALLHADFAVYYQELPDNHFTELWQIQKVLTNDRYNLNEICMLAMFLNVSVSELECMKLPEKTQEQIFDEEVRKLHEQGLKYPEIARRLSASYNIVKPIGEERYKRQYTKKENPLRSGAKPHHWNQMDIETLPLVKDAIQSIQGDGTQRPGKVTVPTVERFLNLPGKRIAEHLPLCRHEIEKHRESQVQYWARETVWAVNQIIASGDVLNWKHVRNLTNMRRNNLVDCLPYLSQFADAEMVKQIEKLADRGV